MCCLLRVEDQVTWIHGPTSEVTRCDKEDLHFIYTHLHVGHASKRKRVGPPIIGGLRRPRLGANQPEIVPTTLVHASMHAKQSIPLIQGRFKVGGSKGHSEEAHGSLIAILFTSTYKRRLTPLLHSW
jgi:hypothetical protein